MKSEDADVIMNAFVEGWRAASGIDEPDVRTLVALANSEITLGALLECFDTLDDYHQWFEDYLVDPETGKLPIDIADWLMTHIDELNA